MSMNEKRILLVDDDEALVKTFQSVLLREGYFVDIAMTANRALKKVEKEKYNLVVLDVVLSYILGCEVAHKIRQQDDEIRIILITGYPQFQECIDSLKLGIQEILLKPIAPSEILRVTREAFSCIAPARPV